MNVFVAGFLAVEFSDHVADEFVAVAFMEASEIGAVPFRVSEVINDIRSLGGCVDAEFSLEVAALIDVVAAQQSRDVRLQHDADAGVEGPGDIAFLIACERFVADMGMCVDVLRHGVQI